ncbi:oligosaccharide flippase family protein [Cryobacterium sp. PH31-AA6]|uniref:lipopolysaccharide biosynthesis protein n=1 Tax=Cryobacterium sp. PH31-AA6 TaxID=3046205 RepID=UPI0024BB8469|nr:oligosaccharide flippase family protein [Cryobacterium sp. PH31-AA6]MDJ0323888.1 oligosaccharide flippase family protein [Cryobacterium sp. PH31-AA6]
MKRQTIAQFAIGPLGAGLFGIVTVPLVAWIYTPEDVGRLYILQTVVALVSLVVFLGLDQAYVREFHESDDVAALLRAAFAPGLLLLVILLVFALPFSTTISNWLFGVPEALYIWITLGLIACTVVSRPLSLVMRMQERAVAFSLSQLLPKAVFVLLVAIAGFAIPGGNFVWLATALLVASASVAVVYLGITRSEWVPAMRSRSQAPALNSLLRFGFPLMVTSLAYWGLSGTSALVLRGLSDLEQVGIYSVAMSVAGVAAIFQAIFSTIWAPVVYKWVARGADMARVETVARQALVIVVLLLALCGTFSWVLDFVLPSAYSEVKFLILCTVVQPLLYTLSEVTGIGISVTRRTVFSLGTTLLALSVNLVLNIVWAPQLGASGAVMANALSFLVYFIGRTEASARLWRRFRRNYMYIVVVAGVLLSLASVLLGEGGGLFVNVLWATYGITCLVVLRDDVRTLYRSVSR